MHSLREKRVSKRCPWGTIGTNGTKIVLPSVVSHMLRDMEFLLLMTYYYRQSNTRGTVLVPFFLSAGNKGPSLESLLQSSDHLMKLSDSQTPNRGRIMSLTTFLL